MRVLILLLLVSPLAAASRKKETEFTEPDDIYECDFSVTVTVPDPAPFDNMAVGDEATLRFARDGGRYDTLISSELRKNWMHQWWIGPQFNPADSKVYGTISCTYVTAGNEPRPVDCQELLEGFFPTRQVVKSVDGVHYKAFIDVDDDNEMAKVSCYKKTML